MDTPIVKIELQQNLPPQLQPPPKSWLKFANYLRMGFAVFLLLTTLLSLVSCTGAIATGENALKWFPAQRLASKELIQSAINQDTSISSTEIDNLKILASEIKGFKGRVILFNFANISQLCGQLGCLYSAFLDTGNNQYQPFWSQYLQPVPPSKPLLAQYKDAQSNQRFPSFLVHQVEGDQLRRTIYSWDGRRYSPSGT